MARERGANRCGEQGATRRSHRCKESSSSRTLLRTDRASRAGPTRRDAHGRVRGSVLGWGTLCSSKQSTMRTRLQFRHVTNCSCCSSGKYGERIWLDAPLLDPPAESAFSHDSGHGLLRIGRMLPASAAGSDVRSSAGSAFIASRVCSCTLACDDIGTENNQVSGALAALLRACSWVRCGAASGRVTRVARASERARRGMGGCPRGASCPQVPWAIYYISYIHEYLLRSDDATASTRRSHDAERGMGRM